MIRLERARGVPAYLLINTDNSEESVLVQTDWDYPSVASAFGFSLQSVQTLRSDLQTTDEPCDHCGTDGTVTCPQCGLTAGDFISAAQEFLEDHIGSTADDPGYF